MPLVLKQVPAGIDRHQFNPSSGYKLTDAGKAGAEAAYAKYRDVSKKDWALRGLNFRKGTYTIDPLWLLYWDDAPTTNEFGEVCP